MLEHTLLAVMTAALAFSTPRPPATTVNPDRTITFRLYAPQATDVRVMGDVAKGPLELRKDEQGVWSVTSGPLEPAIYSYNFIVNGVPTLDHASGFIKPGLPRVGTQIEVPGPQLAFYDAKPVPHGTVHVHWYDSKTVHAPRSVYVYTPPGYESGRATYPALYLLHGSGDTESGWVTVGRANLILDNLIAERAARPMVVVMPFGHLLPAVGLGTAARLDPRLFDQELLEDVMPLIERTYRVSQRADDRAIAGLSMGGGQALDVGLTHLDRFHWIGVFSMGVRGSAADQPWGGVLKNGAAVNKQLRLFWIRCGKDDRLLPDAQALTGVLTEHRVTHTFQTTDGEHTWWVWRNYLKEFTSLLFR
jgi:enterochelin esterase-like enzyme